MELDYNILSCFRFFIPDYLVIGNFESYGLKNKERYDDTAGIENESQKKRDILKKLQSPKDRIKRGYREVNDFIISRRISGVGANKRGWHASEVDNASLEWNIKKNRDVNKKKINEFYKKGAPKKTGRNGIDIHLNENSFDTIKLDKNKGPGLKKLNENGKDRRGKNFENNPNENRKEMIKKKSKTEKPDSNYDGRGIKPLNPEKNQANFNLKPQNKMENVVKSDFDLNDQSNEQLKWDLELNKINRGGKNVKNNKNDEVDSETPIIKGRMRGNKIGKFANTNKTQGSSSKKKGTSKAAEGVLNRVNGRYKCKSLGFMQENLRFGRFVRPSDMLRVKLEERDLCKW